VTPGQKRMAQIAYDLGYLHRLAGRPRHRNPWRTVPLMFKHWNLGWRHANMESLEKITF
jgi:ribosome modulation factor